MADLACPKCGTTMQRTPPRKVWISWCDGCGKVDYAYDEEPKTAGADCPACGTPREDMKIAGPYAMADQKRGRRAG